MIIYNFGTNEKDNKLLHIEFMTWQLKCELYRKKLTKFAKIEFTSTMPNTGIRDFSIIVYTDNDNLKDNTDLQNKLLEYIDNILNTKLQYVEIYLRLDNAEIYKILEEIYLKEIRGKE